MVHRRNLQGLRAATRYSVRAEIENSFTLNDVLSLYTGVLAPSAVDATRPTPDTQWKLAQHLAGPDVDIFDERQMAALRKALEKQYPALKEIDVTTLPVGNGPGVFRWFDAQRKMLHEKIPYLCGQALYSKREMDEWTLPVKPKAVTTLKSLGAQVVRKIKGLAF